MKNVDIVEVHQFLREGVTKKQLYMAACICSGLGKK